MTKPYGSRIFRVTVGLGIAILCVVMFFSQTLKLASYNEQHVNGETGRDKINEHDDVIAHRQRENLKFWNREQTSDADGDNDSDNVVGDDTDNADKNDVIAKLDDRKSTLPGQEEIDFDLRTGGRFSIGSGGDPGFIDLPLSNILIPDLIPPDVHFLWCGSKWFEFKNYLSVMSVRRMIQPDKIYIHFEQEPGVDRVYYNQASRRRM